MARQNTPLSARGFTLVEVMMATVILGLGILGLLALFAGTARQQQEASDATRSLQITRNAQALISTSVGRLTDIDDDPITGELSNLVPDVWYPMTSAGTTPETTALVPRASTNAVGSLFFLADTSAYLPFEIYSGSEDDFMRGGPGSYCAGSGSGQLSIANIDFDGRRLEPCSLNSIVVSIVDYNPGTGPPVHVEDRVYRQVFAGTGSSFGNSAYYLGPDDPMPLLFQPNSPPCGLTRVVTPSCGDLLRDFIRIDLQETPENGTLRANIADINILPFISPGMYPPSYRIGSITIPSQFQFRRSRLVSLSDRTVFTTNGKGQLVPDLGYSLLYRRSSTGSTEVMAATYKIRQTQSGAVYEPKEDFTSVYGGPLSGGMDSEGPLKKVRVRHAYDDEETRRQYYIEVAEADADDRWITEPGTVLLMQGDVSGGGFEGSELSVTVESLVRQDNGDYRGYLDRAPRNRRRILLDDINDSRMVDVWAVQPRITARDDSVWALDGVAIEPVLLFEDN